MIKWIKGIIGFIVIAFAVVGVFYLSKTWARFSPKEEVKAVVLLERVEKVMKLVTVEGSFSEIYDYKHHLIADIWPFRKKALVRINATVLVGYDFEKVSITTDEENKIISIDNIPSPEILSIEHDMDYYNFENGLFNIITNKDITEMGFEAKKFITDKAKESDLFEKAEEQRKDLFELLEIAVEASGWKLQIGNTTPRLSG